MDFFPFAQSPLHIVSAKELRIVNSKLQFFGFGISGLGLGPAYSLLLHLMCPLKHFKAVVQPTNRQNLAGYVHIVSLPQPKSGHNLTFNP